MDKIWKLIFTLNIVTLVSGYNPMSEKLESLLLSLDKLIYYYEQHVSEFNFDGIFGLIPLKGALESITDDSLYENYERVKIALLPLMRQLKTQIMRINVIIRKSVKFFKKARDPYFMKMGILLALKWNFPGQNTMYSYLSDPEPISSVQNISSDECIIQLLNTNIYGTLDCHLSMECILKLMNFHSRGYELVHQVLYILISHQVNCTDSLDGMLSNLSTSVGSLQNKLCSILYGDFVNLFLSSETTPRNRDILLEEMFVCGSLGYENFIQFSILSRVLSWQQPSGCFISLGSTDEKSKHKNTKIMFHERHPLVEHRHADGCLSHMTSVAAAVMGLYFRAFFIPTGYVDGYLSASMPIIWKVFLVRSYTSLPKLIEDDNNQNGNSNQNISNSFANRLIHVKGSMYLPSGIPFSLSYSTHFKDKLDLINSDYLLISILLLCSICIFLYLLLRSCIVYCGFFNSSKSTSKV
ncbi:unnamed protein product [Schistosoma rodhaini]|uniref:UPF0764 protein C16orf89 homolog n=1 Tax=Schistosoma rodhaini TaxID=6188 RepID=A0AA85F709_9TREM|nr:unnamed protein product [Schistosoma rodhaini]